MLAHNDKIERRRGHSLVEVMAVMAILIALGAIVLPSMGAFDKDSRVKAGVDVMRSRLLDARSSALTEGRSYLVTISPDGTKVRVAPAVDPSSGDQSANGQSSTPSPVSLEATMPDQTTAVPVFDDPSQQSTDENGWLRAATILPDGTAREDHVVVEIHKPGNASMVVRMMGLTGAISTCTRDSADSHQSSQ